MLAGCIGVYEIYYWGYIGMMEKKMETTTMGYIGLRAFNL